jgi:ribosomal protein S18 acetylase RimI-like enzyme
LLNDALGSGFVTTEELDELAMSRNGMVLLAKNAHGELIGVATAMVMDEEAKAELAQKLADAGVRRANLLGSKVGQLKSSAVVEAARGKGIGLNLVHERLKRLKDLGCSSAIVLAWDSGSEHSSLGVLEAAGFKRVAELPEYWREPEGQETFDCIKCGRPCICTAVVLRRSLYDFAIQDEQSDGGRWLSGHRRGRELL